MMKHFPVFLFFLVGCDPGPTLKCDYCHAMREGVKRYVCDKCKMPHAACEVERAVMHYEETTTFRGRISYSATGLLVCPSPEDPTKEPVEAVAAVPPALPRKLSTADQIVGGILLVLVFFLGYGKGWTSKKNRDKKLGKDLE